MGEGIHSSVPIPWATCEVNTSKDHLAVNPSIPRPFIPGSSSLSVIQRLSTAVRVIFVCNFSSYLCPLDHSSSCRMVIDYTDHVWTEVVVGEECLHADSCEEALDTPLMYESGWNKKLTYAVAFSPWECLDVTRRYTSRWETEVLPRREELKESDIDEELEILQRQILWSCNGDTDKNSRSDGETYREPDRRFQFDEEAKAAIVIAQREEKQRLSQLNGGGNPRDQRLYESRTSL